MPVINKGKPKPLEAGEVFGGGRGVVAPYKPRSRKASESDGKFIDPADPLHEQIDSLLGSDPVERLRRMQELFPSKLDPRPAGEVETEADGKKMGELRLARWKHQNEQFRKKRD